MTLQKLLLTSLLLTVGILVAACVSFEKEVCGNGINYSEPFEVSYTHGSWGKSQQLHIRSDGSYSAYERTTEENFERNLSGQLDPAELRQLQDTLDNQNFHCVSSCERYDLADAEFWNVTVRNPQETISVAEYGCDAGPSFDIVKELIWSLSNGGSDADE